MSAAWTIREANRDDFEQLRVLFREVWGYSRPQGYDHWRYLTPPDGLCPIAVAEDGDRFAGAYMVWPVRLRIGGRVVLGAQSMDTMTHPDYQGQGVFTKLALACYEMAGGRSFEVMYGFPNPASYPGFTRRLEWRHTGDIAHWIRPIRPSMHPRIPRAVGPLADAAVRLLPEGRAGRFEIRTGPPSPDSVQTLVEAGRQDLGMCHVERSPAWLAWRYSAAAAQDYEWICAYDGGRLAATAVWGMRTSEWGDMADRRAHVVELLATDKRALRAVLGETIRRARASGAMLLETLSNIVTVTAALRRAGFHLHRQAPLIIRPLGSPDLDVDILDHAAWRFMGGDVDTF